MRIIIAGCWRSGTTALFNLVRTIAEQDGTVYAVFADKYDAIEAFPGNYDYEIVKVHKFSHDWPMWADMVFTIWREPDEVLESMKRFFAGQDEETIIRDYGRGLTWFGLYNRKSHYEANYAQLSRSTEKLARHLAGLMGIEIDEKETVRRFRRIKPPKTGYDPVTLLHANHITKK